MNKYTYIILAVAIGIVATTFWYTSPTQQWERQSKAYQEQINTHSGKVKELNDDILHQEEIIKQAKARIESDKGLITDHTGSIEKLKLCISGKSMYCANADKKSLSLLLPSSAYAEAISEPIGVPPTSTGIIAYRNDFQCDKRAKTTGIEYHFTAENYDKQKTNEAKLLAIWNAHTSKTGRVQGDGIGYHYVITQDGTIFNTRNKDCRAIADAGYEKSLLSDENTEHIHISFIGDDKPNSAQTKSMIWLGQRLINEYSLDRGSISSHADNAPKSLNESLKWWYGSKENFTKNFSDGKDKVVVVLRNGVANDAATYAWNTYKDMDFMLTIDQESSWDPATIGDNGHAFGLCQFNNQWHQDKIDHDNTLSLRGKVDYCHSFYAKWKADGVIASMLHGWNNRLSRSKYLTFQ